MDQFEGNSHTEKHTPTVKKEGVKKDAKKVERVVSGEVVRRKQPLGKRVKEHFVQGDATTVWSYIGLEVLLPAAKDAISDAFSQGIDRLLFGEGSRGGGRRRRPGGYTQYSGSSARRDVPPWARDREDPRDPALSRRARATHSFDQVVIPDRVEAQDVLDEMYNLLNTYDAVTVGDFYDLVAVSKEFTDENYGWTTLTGTRIVRAHGGYVLDLPPTEVLNKRR